LSIWNCRPTKVSLVLLNSTELRFKMLVVRADATRWDGILAWRDSVLAADALKAGLLVLPGKLQRLRLRLQAAMLDCQTGLKPLSV